MLDDARERSVGSVATIDPVWAAAGDGVAVPKLCHGGEKALVNLRLIWRAEDWESSAPWGVRPAAIADTRAALDAW